MPSYPIRNLTLDDVPGMLMIFQKVGWGHPAPALKQHLRWCGQGAWGITYRDSLIAISTALMYGQNRAWLGMIATDPAFQGQGHGGRITDTAVEFLQVRQVKEIMLDASEMGLPVYLKRGFRELYSMNVWRGMTPAQMSPPDHPELRRIQAHDLDTIIALDAHAFGVERTQVIKTLISAKGNQGWMIGERAFIVAQKWHPQTLRLGGWVADNPDDANTLLMSVMHAYPEHQLNIVTSEENQTVSPILESHHFALSFSCARMIYGDVPDPIIRNQHYYGAINLAVG